MPNCIPTSATPDSTLSSQHDVHTACARGYEFGQVTPLVASRNCKGERSASEMQSSWLDKILTFLRMKNKCDHSYSVTI